MTRYAAFAGVAIAMAALAAEAQPSVGLPDARLRLLGSTPTTAYFLDLDSVAGQGVVDARVYAVGQRYEQCSPGGSTARGGSRTSRVV